MEAEPLECFLGAWVFSLEDWADLANVMGTNPEGYPSSGYFQFQPEGNAHSPLQGLAKNAPPHLQANLGYIEEVAQYRVVIDRIGIIEFGPEREKRCHGRIL
jgi:hypothetical protein